MMSVSNVCFNCNTKIEDDSYGLTQCPSCQTPIFIDFDGHVQKPPENEPIDEQEASDHSDEPMAVEEDQSVEEQKESSDDVISFAQNLQTEAHLEDQNKITDQHQAFEDLPHENESPSFQEAFGGFSDESKPSSDFDTSQDKRFTDMSSKGTSDAHKGHHFEGLEPKNDGGYKSEKINKDHQKIDDKPLQDVADYGNSSDNLDLGDFYYNIIISDIDSKNLRESVLDALDDSRFRWRKKEIADQIKNGCLTLEKINAAKMYVLISYLKFLPVKIRWDQISLTKS